MPARSVTNLGVVQQVAGGGGGAAAAGGAESNLWATPESPHTADDEFDGADMSGWSVQNITDATAGTISLNTVDAYDTTFNSGDAVRVSLNQRPSWALIQAPANSDFYNIYKPVTVPTNLLVKVRGKIAISRDVVNDSAVLALWFGLRTGGVPDTQNSVRISLSAPYSGQNRVVTSYHGPTGGGQGTIVDGYITDALPYTHEYIAIHKLGTTYHMWLGTGQGAWVLYATYTSAEFTPDFVALGIQNSSAAAHGVYVVGVDYVRFYETAHFIL